MKETVETTAFAGVRRDGLADVHARIAPRFRRREARERARRYLAGLLGRRARKNGGHRAEALGEGGPQGMQRLLNAADWDAETVRDDLRAQVLEHLAAERSGVLVIDETGFVKQDPQSAGVARQYSGGAGRRENQQIGGFLLYASERGAAFLDRALYLPDEWMGDAARRAEAPIPAQVGFATKGERARDLLARAFAAGAPARWVAGDTVHSGAGGRRRLQGQGRRYVLAVPSTHGIWTRAHQQTVEQLMGRLLSAAGLRLSAGRAARVSAGTTGRARAYPTPRAQGKGSGSWPGAAAAPRVSSPTTACAGRLRRQRASSSGSIWRTRRSSIWCG